MEKKNIIVIYIIIVLIIILLIVGSISFAKYNENNSNNTTNNSEEEAEFIVEGAEQMISIYSSKEEVLEVIKQLAGPDVNVSFVNEEDDCWYYKDSENSEYVYCLSNPQILKMQKNNVKK